MLSFFQLAHNTFKECLRGSVYFLILATALVMIGIFPSLTMFVFQNPLKLVIDSCMATTMLFGLFTAVLCAGHTINREMKNGTVLLLMSKPVTRIAYIAAKLVGITLALSVFVFICNAATFVSVIIAKDEFILDYLAMSLFYLVLLAAVLYGAIRNFMAQKSFAAESVMAAVVLYPILAVVMNVIRWPEDMEHAAHFFMPNLLLPALLLLFPAVWLMGIISATLAIRLDFVSNLLICFAVFLLGLVAQYFATMYLGNGLAADFLSVIVPNWQYFWMADALNAEIAIPYTYV